MRTIVTHHKRWLTTWSILHKDINNLGIVFAFYKKNENGTLKIWKSYAMYERDIMISQAFIASLF